MYKTFNSLYFLITNLTNNLLNEEKAVCSYFSYIFQYHSYNHNKYHYKLKINNG